jgi:hypothetical protein
MFSRFLHQLITHFIQLSGNAEVKALLCQLITSFGEVAKIGDDIHGHCPPRPTSLE